MSEEECGICGLELSDKFSYTLNCGHKFHYECILTEYKSKRNCVCPYCRTNNKYLELINGYIPIYGIHKFPRNKLLN